jgi:hypothetical protein
MTAATSRATLEHLIDQRLDVMAKTQQAILNDFEETMHVDPRIMLRVRATLKQIDQTRAELKQLCGHTPDGHLGSVGGE